MYYTYIAKCADETLYCGITTDIARRELEHNTSPKGAKYTSSRRPVHIIYFETFESKSEALKREYVVKKMNKKQKTALCKTT